MLLWRNAALFLNLSACKVLRKQGEAGFTLQLGFLALVTPALRYTKGLNL